MSTPGAIDRHYMLPSRQSNGTRGSKAGQAAAGRLRRCILVLTPLKTVLNMAALQDWAVPALRQGMLQFFEPNDEPNKE